MRVKRFEAATLEEAMRAVKAEFGPDAVVLSTRSFEVPSGERGGAPRRRIEVTAAETEDLGVIRRAMAREGAARATPQAVPPELSAWQEALLNARVPAAEVNEVMSSAARAMVEGSEPLQACATALEGRWPTRGPVRLRPGRPRIVALTGRFGEGRSTLARKLVRRAAGVAPGRVVLLDCAPEGDGFARAVADPDLAGVECLAAPDPWTLSDHLKTFEDAFFIALDLPGFNPLEPATVAAVAERVVAVHGAEVLLVASAATAAEETLAALSVLPRGGVSGIAMTHLDDALGPTAVLEVATRAGVPMAFLSGGRTAEMGLELATWTTLLQYVDATRARTLPGRPSHERPTTVREVPSPRIAPRATALRRAAEAPATALRKAG